MVKVVNHSYIYVMRIRKMLISYVRLNHTLYSINYGNIHLTSTCMFDVTIMGLIWMIIC